uniref:Uncharacterized protein n=1 Tax=Anguilla anguilla TaxID=7936 RepID=A0A0E9T879_ANGAN
MGRIQANLNQVYSFAFDCSFTISHLIHYYCAFGHMNHQYKYNLF